MKFKKPIIGLLVASTLPLMASATAKPEVLEQAQPSQSILSSFSLAKIGLETFVNPFEGVDTREMLEVVRTQYRALEEATKRPWTDNDIEILAKMVYGEGVGVSRDEQKLIVWCVLNRVDYYNESIEAIVTAPKQYHGYKTYHPVLPEIVEMVEETLEEWYRGEEALILPPYSYTSDYLYFGGDMKNNYFRENY